MVPNRAWRMADPEVQPTGGGHPRFNGLVAVVSLALLLPSLQSTATLPRLFIQESEMRCAERRVTE